VNGDSKSTKENVPSLVGLLVCWACHAGTRDFSYALAAIVGPVQNFFSSQVNYFHSFVPTAQQAGRWVTCLSVCVSGQYCKWQPLFILSPSFFFHAGRQFTAHDNNRLVREII
jgi:hypothetical protein